jgi:uncharacterized membrane protein
MTITPNAIAIALHVLSVVIWVGGMFFAWMVLRPVAAGQFEPPQRLQLWNNVFTRFFPWVWASVIILLATGLWLMFKVFGGFGSTPLHIHLMLGIGIAMILIYMHVFFAPYRRLKKAVNAQDWPSGGKALGQIRILVGLNLSLGLVTIIIAAGGRYLGG